MKKDIILNCRVIGVVKCVSDAEMKIRDLPNVENIITFCSTIISY